MLLDVACSRPAQQRELHLGVALGQWQSDGAHPQVGRRRSFAAGFLLGLAETLGMTEPADLHVSQRALQDYMAHRLSSFERATIEQHLSSCKACTCRASSWALFIDHLNTDIAVAAEPAASLSAERQEWIDHECDRFEQAWRDGKGPQISAFLGELAGSDRIALQQELELLQADLQQSSLPSTPPRKLPPSVAAVQPLLPRAAVEGGDAKTTALRRSSTIGAYKLREELARGRLGTTFRARRIVDGSEVAIKVVISAHRIAAVDLERLQEKVKLVRAIRHPNLVTLAEVGAEHNRCYWAMQLVRGKSLAQLSGSTPLSPRSMAAIVHQVAQALVVAHAHGVVHGHLKPTKILLDRRENARLCGLGLAYRVPGGSELTTTGDAFETPHFMPPETASGKLQRPSPLCDVYSLGAVLYFLLAGRAPFQAANLLDVMQRIVNDPVIPPREFNSAVDPRLEAICLSCLQKQPDRRYPSMQALADDLHHYLHRRRSLLRSRGVWNRLTRWWRWQWPRNLA